VPMSSRPVKSRKGPHVPVGRVAQDKQSKREGLSDLMNRPL
jgi:hypothetical protein